MCKPVDALCVLAERRAALLAELAVVDADVRLAAVAEVRSGRPLQVVAREAGVSRPTLYKWLADAPAPEVDDSVEAARLSKRLSEIDAVYERMVAAIADLDTLSMRRETAYRNSRRGKGRHAFNPEVQRTVKQSRRIYAERALLKNLEDNRGNPVVDRFLLELDEAAVIRERLAAFREAELAREGSIFAGL